MVDHSVVDKEEIEVGKASEAVHKAVEVDRGNAVAVVVIEVAGHLLAVGAGLAVAEIVVADAGRVDLRKPSL